MNVGYRINRWVWVLPVLTLGLPILVHAQDRNYAPVIEKLKPLIAEEVERKGLPALSIALIDDQKIVWSAGFGHEDPKSGTLATDQTVYRVGSVSKLFTDLAVMKLVEEGKIDLDQPVSTYLPDFKPENPYDKAITLRQLMAHRSGLVREPPVGHYFDPTNPSLAETVASLNGTTLVYPPEKRIKYSNAAIATVGYVLEKTQKQPFTKYLQQRLLVPLGMKSSAFAPTPELEKNLADAIMWTYHGRTFPAPTFQLGMIPAGSLYTTVLDLSQFLKMIFAEGKLGDRVIAKPETLREMMTLQFAKPDAKEGFGIGFYISELEGHQRIGHGGAIYGFATELAALPDEKLGVVVTTSRDVANAVTDRIADEALKLMLAVKENKPLPEIPQSQPLTAEEARKWAGHYVSDDRFFDLYQRDGHLWLIHGNGGYRMELRKQGDQLIVDDLVSYGTRLTPEGDKLRLGERVYERQVVPLPPPPPEHWKGLIGEYGWDHNILTILEKDGKLHALIEWVFLYPLTEENKTTYAFPDFGLYHGEKIVFECDEQGQATGAIAAGILFKRRPDPGTDGVFQIKPVQPVKVLRQEALKAEPPPEKGLLRKPELVDLEKLEHGLKLDIRYATNKNFLGTPVYTTAKAFMQEPAAKAVVRVHQALEKEGYGLMIHDAYRPWYVTKIFYDATPLSMRNFVADPANGSRHNRGCAVDLTLFDRKTGKPVTMVSGYDEFTDRSYPDYIGGTSRQRWLRDHLRDAMEAEGFTVYEAEWWHFDYRDWRKYPILNKTFEELGK